MDIKFRGKLIDKDKWVYGYIFHSKNDEWFILDYVKGWERFLQVYSKSVGQYTGLKDKNGKEIYEGDIVNCKARIDSANMVVIWEEGGFHLVLCEKYKNYLPLTGYYCIRNFEKEVIGNIYENPELIKESEGEENEH